jgi:hypothetical protein
MAPALKQFDRNKVYSTRATSAQLLADLEQMALYNANLRRSRRIAGWSALGAVVVGAFFLPKAMAERLAGPTVIGAATLCISALLARFVIGRRRLADLRYTLLDELVRLLMRDIPREAELQADLDLGSPNAKRKRTLTEQVGNWKIVHYRDPWLRLAGRFADGTSFEIVLVELSQHRERRKKSPSGKTTYKSKTKRATRAIVKIYPKTHRYGDLAFLEDRARSFVNLPGWVQTTRLKTKAKSLTLATATKAPWSVRRIEPKTAYDGVEMVARMLLSLYQMLHVSKAASR